MNQPGTSPPPPSDDKSRAARAPGEQASEGLASGCPASEGLASADGDLSQKVGRLEGSFFAQAGSWRWAALAALVAGAAARLLFPSLTAYGLDEGIGSILTAQLIHKGQIPLAGVKTSLHFYNPPLLPWVLAPGFLVSRDPAAATLWVALLNLAALAGLGWCAWRLSGRNAAVGAAAIVLASLSPAWIEHSRRLWGHALMLPATVGALCFAVRWLLDRKRWALTGLIACVAAAQGLHFSGALLWISFGLIAVVEKARRGGPPGDGGAEESAQRGAERRRGVEAAFGPAAAGFAIALLWYGPYFVHLVRTDFLDARIVVDALLGRVRAGSAPIGSPAASSFFLLGDLGHNDPMGLAPGTWSAGYRASALALRILSGALMAASVFYALLCIFVSRVVGKPEAGGMERGKKGEVTNEVAASVYLWGLVLAVVPPAAFSLVRASFVPAYLLPAAPGAVLLVAGVVGGVGGTRKWTAASIESAGTTGRGGYAARYSLAALCCVWALVSLANWGSVLRALDTASPESQTFTTLRHQREAVDWISLEAGGEPALVTHGGRDPRKGIDYSYTFLLWAATGDATRFCRFDDWQRVFVIVDSKDPLTPAYARAMEGLEYKSFGNLVVYTAGRKQAEREEGMIRRPAQ